MIKHREGKLNTLNFSEDYYKIEANAKNIAFDIRKTNNQRVLLKNALSNIEEALKRDFSKNSKVISEVHSILSESMIKEKLRDVAETLDFHDSLLKNRKKRLNEQKKKIVNDLESINNK